ncbi:AsnC family transcriptional regulator [Actinomadura hibisca]|uniref:AsnC family transcriptional regulator n=1 Tax=Actinomadura hibisca TaxID=68565 RepID=UPI0014713F4F
MLDRLDWRLLELLQVDFRANYVALATRIGLSRAATRARWRCCGPARFALW